MITGERPTKKQPVLRRALARSIRKPVPPVVATWVQKHLRLPDADMKRMRKLYDRLMDEKITRQETVELDGLMEACAAMDLLRARLLTGTTAPQSLRAR